MLIPVSSSSSRRAASALYGTHSLRRTKPTLIYERTKNLRAVQLLLGHTKLESTIRYLGVEVEDALAIAEQSEVGCFRERRGVAPGHQRQGVPIGNERATIRRCGRECLGGRLEIGLPVPLNDKPRDLDMGKTDNRDGDEPDWLNPANDRKTPYSKEEIERFVEDFICGLDGQEWLAMKSKFGEKGAKERIRAGFIRADENNLINITPEGPIH